MTVLNLIWWSMAPFAVATWTAMLYAGLVIGLYTVIRGADDE